MWKSPHMTFFSGSSADLIPLFRTSSMSVSSFFFFYLPVDNQNWMGFPLRMQSSNYLNALNNFTIIFCTISVSQSWDIEWEYILKNMPSLCLFLLFSSPFNSPLLNCSASSSHLHLILPAASRIHHNFFWWLIWIYCSHLFLWYDMTMISNNISIHSFGVYFPLRRGDLMLLDDMTADVRPQGLWPADWGRWFSPLTLPSWEPTWSAASSPGASSMRRMWFC